MTGIELDQPATNGHVAKEGLADRAANPGAIIRFKSNTGRGAMTSDSEVGQSSFAALRRFTRKRPAAESCELCAPHYRPITNT